MIKELYIEEADFVHSISYMRYLSFCLYTNVNSSLYLSVQITTDMYKGYSGFIVFIDCAILCSLYSSSYIDCYIDFSSVSAVKILYLYLDGIVSPLLVFNKKLYNLELNNVKVYNQQDLRFHQLMLKVQNSLLLFNEIKDCIYYCTAIRCIITDLLLIDL